MGLDMYLEKCNRKVWGYRNFNVDTMKSNKPELYEDLKPYIHQRGSECYHWESLFQEVGYWRKANAIHQWFVDNVQEGIDNCHRHEVSRDQLEKLLDICQTIQRNTILSDGRVKNGETYENGKWQQQYVQGKVIVNPEIADALLPTCDGFFFGSTEYDQWYMDDINLTIEILTEVLENTNFDIDMIVYCSSW